MAEKPEDEDIKPATPSSAERFSDNFIGEVWKPGEAPPPRVRYRPFGSEPPATNIDGTPRKTEAQI
jgi:hypothetical protein